MTRQEQSYVWFRNKVRALGWAAAVVLVLTVAAAITAQAQTYQVIYYFGGGQDGSTPTTGVTMDQRGNLYGTTRDIFGTVYELRQVNSSWIFSTLADLGFQKGSFPLGGVVKGPDGSLFGTTSEGGGSCSCGVVFNLKPPPNASAFVKAGWNQTVLYDFTNGSDGGSPGYGNLVFDKAGNLYGTTTTGGTYGQGTVFKLTPSSGGWTESVIYSFSGFDDGGSPQAGVIFDNAGNLYGTTSGGGQYSDGTVYELMPSGSGWTETVLHSFQSATEGSDPYAGLIFDTAGNLYGTAYSGGLGGYDGSVFELSPSSGGWNFSVLHLFDFSKGEGVAPLAGVTMDASGNLWGTTLGGGGYVDGTVYKLTYFNGYWTYSTVYNFGNDGNSPFGGVTFDSKGNAYGTAIAGGKGACNGGCGVVWEITP